MFNKWTLTHRGWIKKNKPNTVIVAAAKVGGILANSKYPTQFLLDNLKIQNNLLEMASTAGIERVV